MGPVPVTPVVTFITQRRPDALGQCLDITLGYQRVPLRNDLGDRSRTRGHDREA
jgi:hypothetical protein